MIESFGLSITDVLQMANYSRERTNERENLFVMVKNVFDGGKPVRPTTAFNSVLFLKVKRFDHFLLADLEHLLEEPSQLVFARFTYYQWRKVTDHPDDRNHSSCCLKIFLINLFFCVVNQVGLFFYDLP